MVAAPPGLAIAAMKRNHRPRLPSAMALAAAFVVSAAAVPRPSRVKGWIGQHMIEAFGERRERRQVARAARHVGLDHAHALRKTVALDVAARKLG